MKITLRQLEIFVVTAKIANMSRAAEILFLSQSACSMALTTLEQQLDGELFDRHGKKLILNDQGKIVFTKAANILNQVAELHHVMQNASQLSGTLIIGASTTIGNYVLATIIAEFMTLHGQTKINLKINNSHHVIQQLLNFDIDIGFIEGSCYHEDIEVISWCQDQLIIIAALTHPLTPQRKGVLQDLQHQRWIFRELGSGTREKFVAAMGTTIIPFKAIKQAVEAGISCLSKATVIKSVVT